MPNAPRVHYPRDVVTNKLKSQAPAEPVNSEALDRSLSLLALHRRDIILEAIAASAKELLRSNDVTRSIPKVLETIGHATGVERVHLLVVESPGSLDGHRVVGHHFWSAANVTTSGVFKNGVDTNIAEVGLKSWLPRLTRGETIAGNTRSFEEPVRRFLETGGIRSTAVVPVFVDSRWWGMITFDACRSEREWLLTEIDTLKILAELVGAAVARSLRQKSLADANHIIENSPTVLYRLGPKEPFALMFISQNIRRYGYNADELLASPESWTQLIEGTDVVRAVANLKSIADGKSERERLEFHFKHSNGSSIWFEGEASALRDDTGCLIGIEGILTDITERKRAGEAISTLARTDSLTGLPNRSTFLERLQLAFARAKRGTSTFAVLYLDLDRFKDVNDTLGHSAGDALLQAVARRIKECVRETDVVARLGGDEFAILQEDVSNIGGVEGLASKIGTALSAPFAIDANLVHTTVSIGIVLYHADLEGPEATMMKADLALYRAKNEGRNQYRIHVAELDQEAQQQMLIGHDLHEAIGRNEFELFYQPQVELGSGRIVGVEALIRWNHPARGLLLPATFIPVAESNGTILAIGQWVIEQACRQMNLWRDQGIMPPIMAVNISAAQFQFAGQLDRIVTAALEENHVSPSVLELELTESVLMETTQRHKNSFERFRQIGVRLAIDDFGTGFSSLDYLRTFRVARLKLSDRFVNEITSKPDDAVIVRATIGLAHELGIEVVAEGVSTAEQREFLIAAGCKYAQGYYLGKPMPAGSVGDFLQHNLKFWAN